MLCLGHIVRVGGIGVCEVVVGNAVRFAIQSSNASGLLLPVRPHVRIMVILVPPRTNLLFPRLCSLLEELLIQILPSARYHTAPTQSCRPRRSTKRRAIRALASQYGRLVFVPITFAEFEAAVLRPEKEPYSTKDETDAYQSEEGKEATIVNMMRIDSAGAGVILRARLLRGVSCGEVRARLERGESVGAFDEWRGFRGRGMGAGEEAGEIGRERSHFWEK